MGDLLVRIVSSFPRGQFSACLKRTDHFIWFLCKDNVEKLFIGALEDLDCFGCS